MANVSKFNLYGTTYDIKDANARSTATAAQSAASEAQSTASEAQSTANAAQSTASEALSKAIDITYSEEPLLSLRRVINYELCFQI